MVKGFAPVPSTALFDDFCRTKVVGGLPAAESPTVSTRGRSLVLQICANRGFRLHKGGVQRAFLKGAPRRSGTTPPPTPSRS